MALWTKINASFFGEINKLKCSQKWMDAIDPLFLLHKFDMQCIVTCVARVGNMENNVLSGFSFYFTMNFFRQIYQCSTKLL